MGSEWDSSRAGILDRMPVSEKEIGSAEGKRDIGDDSIDGVPSSNNRSAPAPAAPKNDLLDLNDLLDSPAPQTSAPPVANSGGGALDMLDLLGGGGAAAP